MNFGSNPDTVKQLTTATVWCAVYSSWLSDAALVCAQSMGVRFHPPGALHHPGSIARQTNSVGRARSLPATQ
jgi:hypothetical protein